MKRHQELLRRITILLIPQKLIACVAHTACRLTCQQIDQIIAYFHEIIRRFIYFRRPLNNLQKLGQHPLRIHSAAAARHKFLLFLICKCRDPVRLLLRAVMLPKLQVRMRVCAKLFRLAERFAILRHRYKCGRRRVNSDTNHISRLNTGFLNHCSNRFIQRIHIIVNFL